jgi:hypothetical protein
MAAKPNTPNGRDCFGLEQLGQGMRLEFELSSTMTYEQEQGLDNALKAFALERGLVLQCEFPAYQVHAPQGPLSVRDQVALLDGLIDRTGLEAITLTWPLGFVDTEVSGAGVESSARVRFSTSDMGLIGLTLLHRSQRISPVRYLQVLAEFETSQESACVPSAPTWLGVPVLGAMH